MVCHEEGTKRLPVPAVEELLGDPRLQVIAESPDWVVFKARC